jgi:serine/threonine-protein kinase
MLDVARQLECAHRNKILHRDIKLENIVISGDTNQSRAHLIDFGLSCTLTENTPFACVDVEGRVVGSLPYMSPENLQSSSRIGVVKSVKSSFASDVFALGATFYTVMTRRMLYWRAKKNGWKFEDVKVALVEVQSWKTPLETTEQELFTCLQTIIKSMLVVEPSERPSMSAVVKDLSNGGDSAASIPI